jgi:hypothetical protein
VDRLQGESTQFWLWLPVDFKKQKGFHHSSYRAQEVWQREQPSATPEQANAPDMVEFFPSKPV